MAETLACNADMTTNVDIWMDTKTLTGTLDKMAVMRPSLIAHYPLLPTTDFATLYALFLARVAP